jgi:outer membrane protein assembly factor BamA
MKKIFLLLIIMQLGGVVWSQEKERPNFALRYLNTFINDTTPASEPQLLVFPTLAFAPETSWEIGFSSLYVYYAKRDTTNRLSEVSGFTFYTLENQYGLWFDHALYSDKDKWFFLGRLRYQSFPLLFYGIGKNAPADYLARVDGNYLLLKERVLREIAPSLYLGAEFDLQSLHNVNFVPAPDNENINKPLGGQGSTNFGIGLGLVYDNRHNVLNVRDGLFSELAFLRYDPTWGSDFSFSTIVSDTRIFRPINKRDVLAFQLFGQFTTSGQAPFNQLALMGGESIMRGYYLGRYRDENLLATQIEYRFLPLPLGFTKRLGAAAFLATGQVFGEANQLRLQDFLPTGGLGLRYLLFPKKDIYTRLDVAFTREGPGFYFFIGESF